MSFLVSLKDKACAVLQNVYVGLWVLVFELYWLAGPDFAFRREHRKRAAAIARCRERLKSNDDVLLRAELDVLEAEQAAAVARFSGERARYLERLRKRAGLEKN